MRILITSGGTKVAIDPVRNISNSSTGRFGAALAKEALSVGSEVIYLTSQQGQSPFAIQIDSLQGNKLDDDIATVKKLYEFSDQFREKYDEYRYHDFTDYAEMLKNLIQKYKPEIVILSAAVSDYLVSQYSRKKVRSSENLTIKLEQAPKIINQIKQWSPDIFLVGFKLLIDASDAELVKAAMKTMHQSNADIIVANNLASLERGEHEVLLVENTGEFKKIKQNLANDIIKRVLQR